MTRLYLYPLIVAVLLAAAAVALWHAARGMTVCWDGEGM